MKRLFAISVFFGLTATAALQGPAVSTDSLNFSWMVPAVSGTIIYGNPHPSSIRPVADVDLTAAGDPTVAARTGPDRTPSWGRYSLSGFGESPYIVRPAKSGTLNNFITSFDAAKISQHVIGREFLDSSQRIAADTSGNGTIQSYDAALIAAYVVNSPLGHGLTGTWIFNPGNRAYPFVITDITEQDYTAFLLGEVSGNWNNNGGGGGGNRSANEMDEVINLSVEEPALNTRVRSGVVVPVIVQNIKDKGVISYQFELRYDPNVIQPIANPVGLAGTVSRGLSFAVNTSDPGVLRVAVYGAEPITQDGVLLNLKFKAVGATDSDAALYFENVMFNEADAYVSTTVAKID